MSRSVSLKPKVSLGGIDPALSPTQPPDLLGILRWLGNGESRCHATPNRKSPGWHWPAMDSVFHRLRSWALVMLAFGFGSIFTLTSPSQAGQSEAGKTIKTLSEQVQSSLRLRRIRELVPDWQRQCIDLNRPTPITANQWSLHQAVEELGRSVLGAWLIEQAARRSVLLCLDDQTYLEAYYRAHLHMIGLNTKLDHAGRLVFMAHELAHVTQHPHFSNNRRFSPKDMLLLHRIREATAEAVATRVLWQLRSLGFDAAWQAKLKTAYGDIARHFETGIGRHDGSVAELQATRTAFYRWFDVDWRLDIYDDLMLKTLARIADDNIGILPASRQLTDGYLLEISRYAGRRFLEKGDGNNLISGFGLGWLTSESEARLDAILGEARLRHIEHAERPSDIERAGLSASSSGPIEIGDGQ